MNTESSREPSPAVFVTKSTVHPESRGALNGWTVAVKDNIDVAGLRTTGGTRFLEHHVASRDAEVVARLRAEGVTIVGKTLMHELGHGITGVNPTYGTTLHPSNPEFTVGGSSGGSALAVALGYARVALGTDTGGSVRIPAAFTGLVGFRPSARRYPRDGMLPMSPTRDTVGVIGRSVADVTVIDRLLAGNSERPTQDVGAVRRIGVLAESLSQATPEIRAAFEDAMRRLSESGVTLVYLDESRSLDEYFIDGFTVLASETIAAIDSYLEPHFGRHRVADLIEVSESPDVREFLAGLMEQPVSEASYSSALARLRVITDAFQEAMSRRQIDIIAYPTTGTEPPLVRRGSSAEGAEELRATVLNSTPAALAGTPAISLPAGRTHTSHLPAGITFEHVHGNDAALLQFAVAIESVLRGTQ